MTEIGSGSRKGKLLVNVFSDVMNQARRGHALLVRFVCCCGLLFNPHNNTHAAVRLV